MNQPRENPYSICRKRAGFSQEAWAEKLNISTRCVSYYESGERIPTNTMVWRMIQLSSCEWLALRHLQATAGMLGVVPNVTVKSLPLATITLINKILSFAEEHRDRQLLQIAEDGVIDETEQPLFEEIMEDLSNLIGAAYQVKYAEEACYVGA